MRRLISLAALAALALAALAPAAAQPRGARLFLPLLARPPQLVLVSNRDSGGAVDELDADGTGRRTLSGPTTNDSQPVPSPDGRQVAFFSTRDGRNALYVMARDGSGQRKLAECDARCEQVQWLPDGRSLLLSALEWRQGAAPPPYTARVLTIIRLDGGPAVVQPDRAVPSPDGGLVASFSFAGDTATLSVAPSAGGPGRVVLAGLPIAGFSDLAWSPDGAHLAFTAVYRQPDPAGSTFAVYLTDLGGRARHFSGSLPLWSPDGRRLLFEGARPPGLSGPDRLLVLDADGGEPRLLAQGAFPVWSPDSRQVALLTFDARDPYNVLAVLGVEDGSRVILDRQVDAPLGWTPDGARVAYQSGWDEPLRLARREGGAPTLVQGLTRVEALTWSPDGATAAALHFAGEQMSAALLRADGGGLRALGPATGARWAPDNRLLLSAQVVVPPRIYSRSETSADLVPLAAGELIALAPRGDRVAYVRGGRLFVSPTDRPAERALAAELTVTARPAWSPDGAQLAAAATSGGAAGLYLVDAAGDGARLLTGCGKGCADLSFSPDGAALLFQVDGAIFTAPAAGGAPRQLGAGLNPAWSPDGRQIAYVARDIFVMGADGGGARRVTACGTDSLRDSCAQPVWSPDGARLAYGMVEDRGKSLTRTVRIVTLDGAELAARPGWDGRWPQGAGAPVALELVRFGYTSYAPYERSSGYAKLCVEQPCRPYPPGHGDVLEYAIAP